MIEFISAFSPDSQVYPITMTLLHSLWQALILYALLKLVVQLIESNSARYLASLAASLLVFICSICTYLYYRGLSTSLDQLVSQEVRATGVVDNFGLILEDTTASFLASWSTVICTVWLLGVAVHFVKMTISIGVLQFNINGQINERLSLACKRLQLQLNIADGISVFESARANAPYTFGFLKPVIIFPIGLLNMLTLEEVEAILIHELTHIKRQDYLINIVQTILEAFYFFNPAVYWIQTITREEREAICDEAALSAGISPIKYAKALFKLEQSKQLCTPAMAMAINGGNDQLLNRIKRIMNVSQNSRKMKVGSVTTVFIMALAVVFSATILTGTSALHKNESTSLAPSVVKIDKLRSQGLSTAMILPQIDTLPQSKSTVSIHTNTNGKEMSLTKENGKITSLKIDGKEIPESEYENYQELTDDVIIIESPQGNNMMFFGGGEDFQGMDFDKMFDSDQMKQMMEGFRGFGDQDFAFPDMQPLLELEGDQMERLKQQLEGLGGQLRLEEGQLERFEQMMENFGGQFEEMRMDTIFEFDFDNNQERGQRFKFLLDENDSQWSSNSSTVADVLGAELNRDGLLEPFKENRVQLTGKYLKINGDKQPKNIWGKYKRIYEQETGMMMTKRARVDFKVQGKKSNRKIRFF